VAVESKDSAQDRTGGGGARAWWGRRKLSGTGLQSAARTSDEGAGGKTGVEGDDLSSEPIPFPVRQTSQVPSSMWPRCSIWWLATNTCAKNNAKAASNAAQGMRRREIIGVIAISDALGFWPIFARMVAISISQHNAAVRRASTLGPRPNVTPFQRSQSGFRDTPRFF
jgi:hypothetical protein